MTDTEKLAYYNAAGEWAAANYGLKLIRPAEAI
jgi:hypothetical protein